ncbi:MAG: 3-deoxy-7-phosphoheptulonate synthase class II [Thermoanaerobaculales bacterium]|jgi:3-deoxy-7-phosphoheptulonate synthase|nr:3-deoxy-7-phosphoheptulonate synthase class II [Thermoanaerobaculales bacterium]
MSDWTPSSWRARPAGQQPTYPDEPALDRAVAELSTLPPLVTSWEVERLKGQLADAAAGRRFLLQGGACAERLDQCTADVITNKLKVLLQMSLVLTYGLKRRIIRVGRFAGQYAKPRSSDTETRDGVTLPAYRGDLVNGAGFTAAERTPDPDRLLRGYEAAALTLNFIRALVEGGFADIRHPEYWDLEFVEHSPRAREYQRMVESISDSVRFMEILADAHVSEMSRVDFFTSHEGLHLPYEQAVTRRVPRRDGWYNLGTHLPWLGMRTCELDGAHVEYYRGIRNPIGVKVGPAMTPEWLGELVEVLDPGREPGRLTLIHRFGVGRVASCLPPLVEAVRATGRQVVWCCDPMHGNTEKTADGIKTRRFDNILGEVEASFDIHHELGSYLGGIHFELSGDNVTECIGGARGLAEADLRRAYESRVDPRLNYEQSLEMALLIARKMATRNGRQV